MTNKELLSRLYEVIHPYRGKMLIAMIAALVVASLNGAQAWLVKPLMDKIFFEKNMSYLNILPFAMMAIDRKSVV